MSELVKPVKLKTPDGAGTVPGGPPADEFILLETGDVLLLETADKVVKETGA